VRHFRISPNAKIANLLGDGDCVESNLPISGSWFYQESDSVSLSIDNFLKAPSGGVTIVYEEVKSPKLVNESDSFAFVFPSFALFLQQEVGDEVANLQAITEAESLWLGYSNAIKSLYMTYPKQCQICCGEEPKYTSTQLQQLGHFLAQQNETIKKREQELLAIDSQSSQNDYQALSLHQAHQVFLTLTSNYNSNTSLFEKLERDLEQAKNELYINTAELELTQLQIAQLQEELEHYFTLYTQQKNQARQLGISSGVDEHKMLKVENASSLHLITRILSSTTA